MTEFGPLVRYEDPRIYGLVAHYGWGPHQREMLLGTRPWTKYPKVTSIAACLRERGMQVEINRDGVGRIAFPALPPDDPLLPAMLAQWRVDVPGKTVLSLHGPVQEIGGVPIFKACVFGYVEHADGRSRHGLNHSAWITGRQDVRVAWRRDKPPGSWHEETGHPLANGRGGRRIPRVRGSLLRAQNNARRVAAALPDWEEFCAWKVRRDAGAAEAARLADEALAVDEDDVVGAIL